MYKILDQITVIEGLSFKNRK